MESPKNPTPLHKVRDSQRINKQYMKYKINNIMSGIINIKSPPNVKSHLERWLISYVHEDHLDHMVFPGKHNSSTS